MSPLFLRSNWASPHAHAWADTEALPYEYRENANSLAIQLSGTAKKAHGSIAVGDTFQVWLKWDSPQSGSPA